MEEPDNAHDAKRQKGQEDEGTPPQEAQASAVGSGEEQSGGQDEAGRRSLQGHAQAQREPLPFLPEAEPRPLMTCWLQFGHLLDPLASHLRNSRPSI